MSEYSLRKSKKLLIHLYKDYLSVRSALGDQKRKSFIEILENLQNAILSKDRIDASKLAKKAQELRSSFPTKSKLKKLISFFIGLGFALIVAVIVRQMWFELYEIPTGSMRPTFKEKDRVVVSKSKFGINIPLMTKHIFFDRDLCKRMSTIIFTVKNMDCSDPNTLYFYLFPGKKQFVKRLIGKPGDTLYFYGGKIFGIDEDGNDITSELQDKQFFSLEHIPFIRFEGKVALESKLTSSIYLKQMGDKLVKLTNDGFYGVRGKLLQSHLCQHSNDLEEYYDLWGYKNYAMARLVYPSYLQLKEKRFLGDISSFPLLLELHHSPSISQFQLLTTNDGSLFPSLNRQTAYIPLSEDHLKSIFENMYTARFTISDGYIYRYGGETNHSNVKAGDIPNGTYEFFHGKAYQIYPTGICTLLPETHPLNEFSIDWVFTLFNLGIEFNTSYLPSKCDDLLLPSRYSYFRDGELFLLGSPILLKNDPVLVGYNFLEKKKENAIPNYIPFVDRGPPIKSDGSLDTDTVKKYGLTVPDKHYLVLGDNHAMSADSRDFGFVPEENIKGRPSVIYWPPGNRWGSPHQVLLSWVTLPNLVVWILGVSSLVVVTYLSRKKNKLPICFK